MNNKNAPLYPGYGQPCNQCGQCCMKDPCVTANHYGFWREGSGCAAHVFKAGRWWCDFAINPGLYVVRYRIRNIKAELPSIRAVLGITGKCDARKKEDVTHCDFCKKPVRDRFGMDLAGRIYCRRVFCRFELKVKRWAIMASRRVDQAIYQAFKRFL